MLIYYCSRSTFKNDCKSESSTQHNNGIHISRNSLPISHLLYADDVLLICRAGSQKVNSLMQIIQSYGSRSEQSPNYSKSGMSQRMLKGTKEEYIHKDYNSDHRNKHNLSW